MHAPAGQENVDDRPANAQAVRAELETLLANVTAGVSGAMPANIAEGDEQVSGETLATERAQVYADGGSPQPHAGFTADSTIPNPSNPPHRTQTSDVDTSAAMPVTSPKKKSSLPLILAVGMVAVLGAGCVVGGLYYAYSHMGNDGSFSVSALTGGDKASDQAASDDKDDNQGASSPDDDNAAADDGTGDKTAVALAANDQADAGAPAKPDDGSKPQDAKPDDGSKPQDSKPQDHKSHAGSAATTDEGSKNSVHDKPKSTKAHDAKSKVTKVTKVEVHATKVEVHEDPDEGPAVGDPQPKHTVANKTHTTKVHKEEHHEPAKPKGRMRRSKLSATGSACDKPNVEDVLDGAHSRLLSCYSKQIASHPGKAGKIMMSWNISTDGGLISPRVLVSDMSELNSCMLRTIKRLRFEPPDGGRCYVRATYRFSP